MDTSEYPALPRLNLIHARLASNSRRVEAVVDSQQDSIERLFIAATKEEWSTVAEISQYLAQLRPEQVGFEVIRQAHHVVNELAHSRNQYKPNHLGKLLTACRLVRHRWAKRLGN